MPESNIKRINIRLGQELHDWFHDKANELGLSTSALMIVAMNEYRKLQTASDNMPAVTQMIKMMQAMEISPEVQSRVSEAVLDAEKGA